MGYKLWSSNELLTSSDLNTYLAKQSVIVTTSGSKPTPPVNGMVVFETDTNNYVSYNSTLAAWVYLGKMITTAYTANLTAVTTNPTLGTGGSASGRYTLFGGKWCTLRGTVLFGSASTNAGSGQYKIDLPFGASSAITGGVPFTGAGVIKCAGTVSTVTWFIASGATTMAALTTSGNNVASGAPGAWTANDYLSFTITYEMA